MSMATTTVSSASGCAPARSLWQRQRWLILRRASQLLILLAFLSGPWFGVLRRFGYFRQRFCRRPDFRAFDSKIPQGNDANEAFVAVHNRQAPHLALAHHLGCFFD